MDGKLESTVGFSPQTPFTELLLRSREGDKVAFDALLPVVYGQLHALASRCLRSERPDHTLRTTALVHEAYLKLVDAEVPWQDRSHFFAVAARAMRNILVDHARSAQRQKRGGGANHVALEEGALITPQREGSLLDLDDALEKLSQFDPRKGRAVELVYFGGLSNAEAAMALEISEATLQRDLKLAKAWIQREMTREPDERATG